jgi:predicted transcriptional regulator of viral defense system
MPGRNFKTLFDIAADNYGFVTLDDARRVGIRPQRLVEMAARGALRREGFGVYRVEPFPVHEFDTYRKATLWPHGADGILSHETALELYGLSDVNPAKIHITVPKHYRVRHRKLPAPYLLHHEDLRGNEVTRFEGLPIVTAATAIRQCLKEGVRRDLLRQAIGEAKANGTVTQAEHTQLLSELEADPAVLATA